MSQVDGRKTSVEDRSTLAEFSKTWRLCEKLRHPSNFEHPFSLHQEVSDICATSSCDSIADIMMTAERNAHHEKQRWAPNGFQLRVGSPFQPFVIRSYVNAIGCIVKKHKICNIFQLLRYIC